MIDDISGGSLSNTMTQDIELNQGWNLISTYIIPDYPNISDVFQQLSIIYSLQKMNLVTYFGQNGI